MAGRLLLDTNAVIALFAAERPAIDLIEGAGEVFVPVIALGELLFGARRSSHAQANERRILDFASQCAVASCDAGTADHYGRIKHALQVAGRPIPENDIWIAALALQHDLVLMTQDRHFDPVNGLAIQ